ncbi:MAG: hypothetical protein HY423_15675 [Candidatus Lambdaproteobacteria bacterium]|nr:hypothetical protein [Candidatus Lambdaproteobacteria bacterium]
MAKKSSFTTVYEGEDAGTVGFQRRPEIEEDVVAYLDAVVQLKQDFKDDAKVAEGLREIELKLKALRVSQEPEAELRAKLKALAEVPFGQGKTLRLDAFRKTAAKSQLEGPEEYLAQVQRLVRNTEGNLAHLLLTFPNDTILQRFMESIKKLDLEGDYKVLRNSMVDLGKSPLLWHYNEKKKEFLIEWLRPFQDALGKPLHELTPEEFQEALKKVEQLRNIKLHELTNLEQVRERAPYRAYNRTMHEVMNGKNREFWGSSEVRDEFIALMGKVVTRFSFSLEERFLLFRTKDGGFMYLVGFADEAFDEALVLKDGKLAMYPHLKVFLKADKDEYAEIVPASYHGNMGAYYTALKTAVVPFLAAVAVMVEFELSPKLKEAFDMWV